MDSAINEVRKNLSSFFGEDNAKSPARKSHKRDKENQASESGSQGSNVVASGLSNADKIWIKDALGELTSGLGGLIQQVNQKCTENSQDIKQIQADVAEQQLQTNAQFEHIAKKFADLEERTKSLEAANKLLQQQLMECNKEIKSTHHSAQQAAAASAIPQSGPSENFTVPPPGMPKNYQDRNVYVMGNLGKDLSKDECEDRARDVLTRVGQPPITEIYAPFVWGSQVVIKFVSPQDGAVAKEAVRKLEKKFESCEFPVWCDVKKSKSELDPGRIIRETARQIEDHVKTLPQHQRLTIVACLMSKRVYANREQLCATRKGKLVWFPKGEQYVPDGVRQSCENKALTFWS